MRNPDKPILASKSELDRHDSSGLWLCQPKWDGYRITCRHEWNGWQVYPRRPGRPPLKVDSQILDDLSGVRTGDGLPLPLGTILDGELLTPRRTRAYTEPERIILYGVLYVGGDWRGDLPETDRLAWLSRLGLGGRISLVETREVGFSAFYESTKDNPILEGVVLKRRDARLIGNETKNALNPAWLKIKWRGGYSGRVILDPPRVAG